jgi:hypothetical protein
LLGDRRAQTSAAVATGNRGVGLGEALEDAFLRRAGDANAGIDDLEMQMRRIADPGRTDEQVDAPGVSELDGVADQVDQYLAQVRGITAESEGRLRRNVRGQGNALFTGDRVEHLHGPVDQEVQVERFFGEDQPAGFDARKIQDVVDQAEQGIGRVADHLRQFLLFTVEAGFGEQVGNADDAIQGCTQFVAHVRQELRLCLICLLFTCDCRMQLSHQRSGIKWNYQNAQQKAEAYGEVVLPVTIEGED